MNFYKFYMGDYQRDTNRLSFIEDAAYRRLLDEYYATEHPLPLHLPELYRATRATSPEEQAAVEKVLHKYFVQTPEGYRNSKVEKMIADYHKKSAQARANAKKRYEKPAPAVVVAHPTTVAVADAVGKDTFLQAIEIWNSMATQAGLPLVQVLTERRKVSLRKRLAECGGLDGWAIACDKVQESPFLTGENERQWKATFDFLLKPSKFTLLMEGGYASGTKNDTDGQWDRIKDAVKGDEYGMD